MTTPDTNTELPPDATKAIGSYFSPYTTSQAIDAQTGDWYDWSSRWQARDVEEMLATDGRAKAIEQVLTLPLRAAPLSIRPAPGDTGEADFVNDSLEHMDTPVEVVKGQAAQSLIYRTTFLEKIFTVERGFSEYEALAWRPVDSCALMRDPRSGMVTGFRQEVFGQVDPVRIVASKAAVFLHGANRDPVRGVSEMEVTYRCFRDKQKLRQLWTILAERTAAPWVILQTAAGQEVAVANTVAQMRAGGVAAISELVNPPTVLNVAGDSSTVIQQMITYLDGEMASSVMAGFLNLTSRTNDTATGSYALSKDQTDFFTSAQDASAKEIAATFRHQIVTPLVRLNKGPAAVIPDVTLGPISGADLQQIMTLLGQLAAVPPGGAFPQEFTDELVVQASSLLDLDVDKVAAAIKTQEATAALVPAGAATAPVHAAVSVLHSAAAQQQAAISPQ